MAQKKPKMTVAQFMKELAKHRDEFKIVKIWHSLDCKYDSLLRAGCNPKSACPITKVYTSRFGKPLGANSFLEAAEKIGLNGRTTETIMRAADAPQTPHERKIRRQMLKVLGLKEVV